MNVSDEIRRIEKDLAYIKIQLSNVRAYGGGHTYPYSDMANIADPGVPGAGYVRFFANNEHLIGLTSDDSWHDLSAGAKGVSSCIHEFITVTDAGGLNITWSAGKIFDAEITGGSQIIDIPAQPVNQACAASELNYLFYDHSAGALVLNTIGPDYTDGDFSVAHILTLHNDILGILQRPVCYESIQKIRHVLREAFPAVISSGMLISEHAGANAFDVDQSPGSFAYGGFQVIPGDAIDSTVKNIIRWYHNAADAWETDTNSQIDAANWDDPTDGAAPQANTANKYYRSTFYSCGDHIHWVYPQVEYDNINAALIAPDPTPPAALEHLPKTVTVVLKGNATAFPAAGSDQWIDVRPMLGVSGGRAISSHKNLSDLAWTSCGHTGTADRYIGFNGAGAAQERTYAQVLADLSGQAGAAFNWNNKNLVGIKDLTIGGNLTAPDIITGAHLSSTFGNEGTSLTNFIPAAFTNRLYVGSPADAAASGDMFTAKINSGGTGGLTATNVPYDTDSNAAMMPPLSPPYDGCLVLHNLTRGNSRLITDADTVNKNITTVASTDDWADNDDLTIESQTCSGAAAFMDLDISSCVPSTCTAVLLELGVMGSNANQEVSRVHPYEAYGSGKIQQVRSDSTGSSNYTRTICKVIDQKIGIGWGDSGGNSIVPLFRCFGWWEKAET